MANTVTTQILKIGDFTFDSGDTLPDVQLAYETYGSLNADKSNAILLFHALTGSHHAHGYNDCVPEAGTFWQPEYFEGWWDKMIGPGQPLDTERYFIICVNFLGSCYGSTGPADLAPDGEPWGSRFPLVNANDQARAQIKLLDYFGIDRFALIGPSVGGMLSLAFTHLFPERVRSVIIIGANYKPAIEHKLSSFEQFCAIEMDEKYCAGRYPLNDPPLRGVALARIICHKHFVYQKGLAARARKGCNPDRKGLLTWFTPTESTQSYMLHQGTKFAKRFDANAYIRIINMWTSFDLESLTGLSTDAAFRRYADYGIPFMLFSIDTDCCFSASDIEEFHQRLVANGVQAQYKCIHSEKGHDSFLLEPELYQQELNAYLA